MSAGNAAAVAVTLVGGIAGTVQVAVMGRFGDRIGIFPAFAFATAVTAALAALLLLLAHRSVAGYGDAVQSPPWLWAAGLMGAVVVLGITFAAPRIGTTATVAIFVFAQFAAAAVIDRYGLFGLDRIPLSWPRVLGLALLCVGAALTLKK
jgi:bacterial/archaeal transporter family-2 protein